MRPPVTSGCTFGLYNVCDRAYVRSDEGESNCFGDNSTLRYQTRVTKMMNMPALVTGWDEVSSEY